MTAGTADRIRAAAEARIRSDGYHGFSFRDLAADVGIKSASVHHHFATKPALVKDLVAGYTARFAAALEEAAPGPDRVARCRALFREALTAPGDRMCLCGMLAAEAAGLPPDLRAGTAGFFATVADRLAEGLDPDPETADARALAVLARLEGALLVSRVAGGVEVFDRLAGDLGH